VVQQGQLPPWPMESRSVELFESGTPIGRLTVSRSLRGLAVKTGIAALLGLALGGFVFLAMRSLPLRVLNRTFNALGREKERAQVTLHSIGDAVIATDREERIDFINPVAERLTGWHAEEARGQPLGTVFRIIDELTGKALASPLAMALGEKRIVPLADHTTLVQRDGRLVAIEDSAAPIILPNGEVVGGVLVFRDVTAARELSQKLSWQASHDGLTGLPNRPEFERRLDEALNSVRSTGHPHVMCYLDLDQFKVINDTCGHAAGDELLHQICELFQQHVRQSDLLARLGGDEFGILFFGCPLERARTIAENLLAAVRAFRFNWENKSFGIGVSIGIVALTTETLSKEQVMSSADSACYAAKEGGRNRIVVFEPEDDEMQQRREEMGWTSRIRRAMDENRLVLYYQEYLPLSPQAGTGRHFEVLLRMVDDDGEVIAPGAFIPAAERYGLMPQIDQWVVAKVFSACAGLGETFGSDFACSINLSGTSINQDHLLAFIREQAALYHVRAESICFEITESATINQLRKASRFILDLKRDGFRFALDDFGTGMSSFAYLRNLAVDYLKIDGSFVRDVATDPVTRAMVSSINEIGHVMGLQTIAEFVDSEAVLEQLREIGVDFAQGYVIAKPVPLPLDAISPNVPAQAK
jgi:diguanylate cyclase (GGDEF)-like protein/PAS domain S-box-containing protein